MYAVSDRGKVSDCNDFVGVMPLQYKANAIIVVRSSITCARAKVFTGAHVILLPCFA